MNKIWQVTKLFALALLVLQMSCKDSGTNPSLGQWEYLGFEDKFALRLVLAEPYLYVCAGSDGLWRRNIRQAGYEWEYLGLRDTSLGRYIDYGVRDVLVHCSNPGWMLVAYQPERAGDHTVYRSFDGGITWLPADSGLEVYENGERYFYNIGAFKDYQNYIIAAGDAVFRTLDFGQTWNRVEAHPSVSGDVLERHPVYGDVIWLGGEGLLFQPLVAFSMNGGMSWFRVPIGRFVPVDNAVYSIAFDSHDPNIVYVGMQGAIIKTTDGGQSWIVPLVTNPRGEFFRAILTDPRNQNHLWAAGGPDLIETWDAGLSWKSIESPIPKTTKVFDMLWDEKQEVIYVATLNGIYRFKS